MDPELGSVSSLATLVKCSTNTLCCHRKHYGHCVETPGGWPGCCHLHLFGSHHHCCGKPKHLRWLEGLGSIFPEMPMEQNAHGDTQWPHPPYMARTAPLRLHPQGQVLSRTGKGVKEPEQLWSHSVSPLTVRDLPWPLLGRKSCWG